MSEGRPQLASRCSHCFAPSIPRDIGAARARVKPINFQTETLPAVRKKAVFGPQSADNFSELSLMGKTLPLPLRLSLCGVGNHVDLCGLPGGAEGIRTDDHFAMCSERGRKGLVTL